MPEEEKKQKQEKETVIDLSVLDKVAELTKKQMVGFLSMKLNDIICERLEVETFYRLASDKYDKVKGKEKEQGALASMQNIKGKIDMCNDMIKYFRSVIKDIEAGNFEV